MIYFTCIYIASNRYDKIINNSDQVMLFDEQVSCVKWIPGTQSQVAQTGEDKMLRYAGLLLNTGIICFTFHASARNASGIFRIKMLP